MSSSNAISSASSKLSSSKSESSILLNLFSTTFFIGVSVVESFSYFSVVLFSVGWKIFVIVIGASLTNAW